MNFRKLRGIAALSCAVIGMAWSSIGLIAQPRKYEYDAVATEGRLTRLETRLDEVAAQIKDIHDSQGTTQNVGYMALLMLSGLAGEAGIRLYRKKGED